MTDEEMGAAIASLPWVREEGTYRLPESHSSIVLPHGYLMVTGEAARRLETLQNPDPSNQYTEAAVITSDFESEIIFESLTGDGYVSLDDWNDINAAALLREISDNTESANAKRREQGMAELHVVGWLQPPTLDRSTSTVYWAVEGSGTNGRVVNSIALRLGRDGYERVAWITDPSRYVPVGGQLDVMLRAHSFDPGYRYADHQSGDKTALYGIAGLVATVTGAKAVKVAAGAGLLVLLKKFGVFIFAAIAAVLYRLKNLFRRRPPPQPIADRVEPKL
jgi:uncharacterized membrane-anchored protein